MSDPTCTAPVAPGEVCGETASWRRDDGMLLCQAHNDYDLVHGDKTIGRHGVWEDFAKAEETVEERPPEAADVVAGPNLELDDLTGRLLTMSARWPLGLLVKICFVGLQRYIEAHDRWIRLESPPRQKRAPLWLDQREADKLVAMLAGQRGADARLIRQEIQRLFEPTKEGQ